VSEILLGQSYYLRFDPKLWAAMQPYPPLGTLYAAGYLRQRGYDVALFDAMLAESEADWQQALQKEKPRFAVIYEDSFNYLSKMCLLRMRQAAFTMAEMAHARGCTVIACGSDATDQAAAYLAHGVDYVLLGEGEATLGELMDSLSGRRIIDARGIRGLAYVAERAVRCNARRPLITDLDSLPSPAWDMVDIPRYQDVWRKRHGYYSMNMVTTRGCAFHCNWCAKPMWGQRYNVRSPHNVAAELKWLKQTYGLDHVWFADDIMGLQGGWMEGFAESVSAEGIRTPFKCLSRADLLLRSGEIAALQRAGAESVWMGAESGSQEILDAMEKGTRVEQIYDATRRLHAAGIRVAFFLQFGYPGETWQDVQKTLRMVQDCRPDDIGMSVSYPLPGTRFFERVKGQMGEKQNWSDSRDLAMLYKGPYTTAFYRQVHKVLHREFRMHKHWRELKQALRSPGRLKMSHLRQALVTAYYALALPWDRWRLRLLEKQTRTGLGPLPPGLPHAAAAMPSPQTEMPA
jgi:anaerobic magnesium-protoporphyrin IX monomethyl ester cyclase